MDYKIHKTFGTIISSSNSSVELRVQLMTWGDGDKVYDIRSWRNDKPMRGITLSAEGMKNLKELLRNTSSVEVKDDDEVIKILTTLPATDVNYKATLEKATPEQIAKAIKKMSEGGRHKSRINACKKKKESAPKTEKSQKKDKKIVKFPTEKPEIVPLPPTDEAHSFEECCKKLNKEREMFNDSDSKYVIDGLLKVCKDDQNLRNNIMREDKSYAGAFEYFASKARNGYCMKFGNVSYLDNALALDLAIDYFNMQEGKKK